jgi:hypothetical protein
VIVRISGEGQFELPDADAERRDEAQFDELWRQMLDLVASDGRALPEDELVGSDVILPPRDVSFEEARAEFTGEGLIPD